MDTLASLIQLFNSSEHSVYHDISRCHADTVLDACRTGSGALDTDACFTKGILRPIGQAGDWSRGQAWGMLGLSRAAAYWGEPYLTYAQTACDYWRRSRPEAVPPNRLSRSSGTAGLSSHCDHWDPSSSVIASLAMLCLADLMPDGNHWRIDAHGRITDIIRSPYFIGAQKNGHDQEHRNRAENRDTNRDAAGIFWGCCYETNPGTLEPVESPWGSFFLMAALCILAGVIKPSHC